MAWCGAGLGASFRQLWSPSSCAASCGSVPLTIVRQYIQQQRTPNQRTAMPPALSIPARRDEAFRVTR